MNLVERSHSKLLSSKADSISCSQLTGMGYIWPKQSIHCRPLPELGAQGPLNIFRAWFTELISYFYIRVKWIMFLSCLFPPVDWKLAVTSSHCRKQYFVTGYISGFQKKLTWRKKRKKEKRGRSEQETEGSHYMFLRARFLNGMFVTFISMVNKLKKKVPPDFLTSRKVWNQIFSYES